MDGYAPRHWLLLTYRVPRDPSCFRTYIWRQVKALGCLYLQQAVWLLPLTSDLRGEIEKLSAKIKEFGGESSVLTATSPSQAWEERVTAGFNAIHDEEYAKIAEKEERFEDEIRRETRREKFTFAELEDVEAEWEKLKRWPERVGARDFFGAPGRQETEARLEAGERILAELTRRVHEYQGVEDRTAKEGADT